MIDALSGGNAAAQASRHAASARPTAEQSSAPSFARLLGQNAGNASPATPLAHADAPRPPPAAAAADNASAAATDDERPTAAADGERAAAAATSPARKGKPALAGERKLAARPATRPEPTSPAAPPGAAAAADGGAVGDPTGAAAKRQADPTATAPDSLLPTADAAQARTIVAAPDDARARPGAAAQAASRARDALGASADARLQIRDAASAADALPAAPTTRLADTMGALAAAGAPAAGAAVEHRDATLPPMGPLPALASASAPAPGAATPSAAAEATLAARPGSAEFAPQLGAQITTFVRNGIEHAQLHLNPGTMGPVTVQIQLDGRNAQVHLAAEHGLTRQALEQAMPLLASSLREAGLTLSGGGVFEQPRQGRDAPGGDKGPGERDGRRDVGGVAAADAAGDHRSDAISGWRRRGIVDLVA